MRCVFVVSAPFFDLHLFLFLSSLFLFLVVHYIIVRRRAQETTQFRKSKALGCGVPSVVRNATTGPEAF